MHPSTLFLVIFFFCPLIFRAFVDVHQLVCVCVRVGARSEILVYKKNKRNGKWHNCFNSPENVRWFGETMPKKTVATATTGQINVIDVVISEPVLTGIHLKVTIFVFVVKTWYFEIVFILSFFPFDNFYVSLSFSTRK